jgi:hypothetical protein
MTIKNRLRVFFSAFLFWSSYAVSCAAPGDVSYPPFTVDGGMIIVSPVPVLEDEGKQNPEMGLGLSFLNCSTGTLRLIARLPYVADPGEVRDIFTEQVEGGDRKLFVIHSAPIRAFTGAVYGSDYFSVMVFHKIGDTYSADKVMTGYFGSGADVLASDEDQAKSVYTYPYKTRDLILAQLVSKNYLGWAKGELTDLVINKKTSIYSLTSPASVTKMYLVSGDKVKQESISAGWISILYITKKGKEIRGWVPCESVDGC